MKRTFAMGLALCLTQIVASPLLAANKKVTIVNQTGYAMQEFYGSNNGTTDWEEDILGEYTLPHGEAIEIDFDDNSGHCIFDFLAVFEDGDSVHQEDVDICTVGTFTFN